MTLKAYVVTLRHDNGTVRIKAMPFSSPEAAVKSVLKMEHAPESAVLSVAEVTW